MNANVDGRDVNKVLHGVVLPLFVFVSANVLLFVLAFFHDEAASIILFPFYLLYLCLCGLVILMVNALLMIPKWKKHGTVWFMGLILPVCILVVEVLLSLADKGPIM